MKIAILTQPLGTNYGGIMQAWALQRVLAGLGHDPVTIDRRPAPPAVYYKVARAIYRSGMKVLGKRKALINFEQQMPKILENTSQFIRESMFVSESLYSTSELSDHFARENYDAVIVGSDQTWRPKYSPNIYNYFLDFIHEGDMPCIAYASSFGVDEWEFTKEQTHRCAELAKKFNAISVRERSGVELCSKYLGVKATHALDPTVLLDKKHYLDLLGEERIKARSFGVFTYFLDQTREKHDLARALGEKYGEPVYSCQPKYALNEDCRDLDSYIMPDVRDWLAGFSNASFVITDSFHGMIFSFIFGKPFYVLKNKARGSARFLSFLSMYGLEDRIIDENEISRPNDFEAKSIDWGITYDSISDIRDISMSFLIEAIPR